MRRNRRVKILATLGPSSGDAATIEKLFRAGADVFRINMSHTSHQRLGELVALIRGVEAAVGRPISILADLQGPKLRVGAFASGPADLENGKMFTLDDDPAGGDNNRVNLPHHEILISVQPGHRLLLDDGKIRLRCIAKPNETTIEAIVEVGGRLSDRKGVSLPDTELPIGAMTPKDHADLEAALAQNVDWVALSFVQRPEDIAEARAIAGKSVGILAKIEKPQAIDRLPDIIALADAIMVARGDLGIECPFEELPVIQRRAVNACLAKGRPVIIATHMLESMITQPVPTRAEITDVANAVYERADCVMLSGETTIGKYPRECLRMLDVIARRIEQEASDVPEPSTKVSNERIKVLNAAVVLANQMPDSKLLTFTRHGFMARGLASLRPVRAPIFALTPSIALLRQLRLLRGVEPYELQFAAEPHLTIESAISLLKQVGQIKIGDKLIICTDILAQDRVVDSIQLRTVL